MMLEHPYDNQAQPADVLFGVAPTIPAPPERHWFVADETGAYCLACNLPTTNRRHVARAA